VRGTKPTWRRFGISAPGDAAGHNIRESKICLSWPRVNQWVMLKKLPGEANIHYGKLLLVNRPHQNREKCP
jgi:hypothetical protein